MKRTNHCVADRKFLAQVIIKPKLINNNYCAKIDAKFYYGMFLYYLVQLVAHIYYNIK